MMFLKRHDEEKKRLHRIARMERAAREGLKKAGTNEAGFCSWAHGLYAGWSPQAAVDSLVRIEGERGRKACFR